MPYAAKLGAWLLALALLVCAWPARPASAAPPQRKQQRHSERELSWLSPEGRARIEQVEPFVVVAEPVAKDSFASQLGTMCARYQGWSYGEAESAAEIQAMSEGEPLAGRVASLASTGTTEEILALAKELAGAIEGLEQICDRVRAGAVMPDDLTFLRGVYRNEHELRRFLRHLAQIYEKAGDELGALLEAEGPQEAEAQAFITRADIEFSGTPHGAFSTTSLGALAQTGFEGLAEFLVDRAKEEAMAYLREQLVERICSEQGDPILFIPETCELLTTADPSLSISAIGAALHAALLEDLELLPDRVLVLAWEQVPEVAHTGTGVRVLMPLVRSARERTSPLEFVASLHGASAMDCETLAGPGHQSGDERCADTMAVLRLASMVTHVVASQTTTTKKTQRAELRYLSLAVALGLEQRFAELPSEAQARVLAALGWERFEFQSSQLVALDAVVSRAEELVPRLEQTIDSLADSVSQGLRPAILDEEMYRLATTATADLTELARLTLVYAEATKSGAKPGAEVELSAWQASLDAALEHLPDLFGFAQSYADRDWATGTLATISLAIELIEEHAGNPGEAEAQRYAERLQALRRYLPLFIEIANAKSSDEVNAALQAAFPAGGFKLKFRQGAVSINGFLGVYGGGTVSNELLADNELHWGRVGGEFSLFAPIGVHATRPIARHKPRPWHWGMLISAIDLGGITTSKWVEEQVNPRTSAMDGSQTEIGEPAAFNLAGLLAPGAYLTLGIAKSPFVLGAGVSVNPFAHKRTITRYDSAGDVEATDEKYLPVLRFGAFLAVDITFVSFGLR
jgi:hypothetical protein